MTDYTITLTLLTACLIVTGCQEGPVTMPKAQSDMPASPISPSESSVEMESSQKTAIQSGKCHVLTQPRTFFRFASQPITKPFKFSMEVTTNIQHQATQSLTARQMNDIQKQLIMADSLYQQVLQLRSPLRQPRYQQAKFINVTLVPDEKAYGRAYDEVTTNDKLGADNCFLSLKISNQVQAARNNSPAHELFHLYQNGYMMFKQVWLTEGLARWSESLFTGKESRGETTPLPQNKKQLQQVMSTSYGASSMWTRLFEQIDNNKLFIPPNHVAQAIYTNHQPVIKDNRAYGTGFIGLLFDELSLQSLKVSQDKGWPPYDWSEKAQRSADLNPYIWEAIKRAVNKAVPASEQSDELKRFLAISLTS